MTFNGEKLIENLTKIIAETNSATKAINISAEDLSLLDPSKYYLFAKLKRNGLEIDRTIKPLSLPKDWQLPEASLNVKLKKINDKYFDLLACESRTVFIQLRNSSNVEGFKIRAWNTELIMVLC